MEPQLSSSGSQNPTQNTAIRNFMAFLVIFFLMVLVFANYGNLVDLSGFLSYVMFPSKKTADFEKLTGELLALYGSVPIEYYYNENAVEPAINNQKYGADQDQLPSANLSGNYLYIPSINVNVPIITGTSIEARTILEQLKQGALMYPGSNPPGNGGMTVIIGHSSSNLPWQKYGRVFSKLPDLSGGDMIILNYNGIKYSYFVNRKLAGSVDELASLDVRGDLILGTCWPIGAAEKRILITASSALSTL